ncbi:hypothetical protein KV201_22025 [Shewanella sp. SR1]|uniref:hypothetical protein n=1 Tax=Shewanella sp. SR1 TaxID=2855505 RepID=UPI001CF1ADA5|nr:hypothetical protein [Shewanella sp. SR1]MCB2384811.1 hypothetical protein [Shewanella sp. SR1]
MKASTIFLSLGLSLSLNSYVYASVGKAISGVIAGSSGHAAVEMLTDKNGKHYINKERCAEFKNNILPKIIKEMNLPMLNTDGYTTTKSMHVYWQAEKCVVEYNMEIDAYAAARKEKVTINQVEKYIKTLDFKRALQQDSIYASRGFSGSYVNIRVKHITSVPLFNQKVMVIGLDN